MPPLENLPTVEFTEPADPNAILCLDPANMDRLAERTERIDGYVSKLRAALESCY